MIEIPIVPDVRRYGFRLAVWNSEDLMRSRSVWDEFEKEVGNPGSFENGLTDKLLLEFVGHLDKMRTHNLTNFFGGK